MDEKKLLDNIQYFISSIIGICFGIGLIPTFYDDVFPVIAFCLGVQILISIIRQRLLNVFLEIFVVGIAALSYIPILGYVFRFVGIILSILEMASFKDGILYKQMDMRTFRTGDFKSGKTKAKKKKPAVKKPDVKFEDAEFSEK